MVGDLLDPRQLFGRLVLGLRFTEDLLDILEQLANSGAMLGRSELPCVFELTGEPSQSRHGLKADLVQMPVVLTGHLLRYPQAILHGGLG
jgi:hypothetical protein